MKRTHDITPTTTLPGSTPVAATTSPRVTSSSADSNVTSGQRPSPTASKRRATKKNPPALSHTHPRTSRISEHRSLTSPTPPMPSSSTSVSTPIRSRRSSTRRHIHALKHPNSSTTTKSHSNNTNPPVVVTTATIPSTSSPCPDPLDQPPPAKKARLHPPTQHSKSSESPTTNTVPSEPTLTLPTKTPPAVSSHQPTPSSVSAIAAPKKSLTPAVAAVAAATLSPPCSVVTPVLDVASPSPVSYSQSSSLASHDSCKLCARIQECCILTQASNATAIPPSTTATHTQRHIPLAHKYAIVLETISPGTLWRQLYSDSDTYSSSNKSATTTTTNNCVALVAKPGRLCAEDCPWEACLDTDTDTLDALNILYAARMVFFVPRRGYITGPPASGWIPRTVSVSCSDAVLAWWSAILSVCCGGELASILNCPQRTARLRYLSAWFHARIIGTKEPTEEITPSMYATQMLSTLNSLAAPDAVELPCGATMFLSASGQPLLYASMAHPSRGQSLYAPNVINTRGPDPLWLEFSPFCYGRLVDDVTMRQTYGHANPVQIDCRMRLPIVNQLPPGFQTRLGFVLRMIRAGVAYKLPTSPHAPSAILGGPRGAPLLRTGPMKHVNRDELSDAYIAEEIGLIQSRQQLSSYRPAKTQIFNTTTTCVNRDTTNSSTPKMGSTATITTTNSRDDSSSSSDDAAYIRTLCALCLPLLRRHLLSNESPDNSVGRKAHPCMWRVTLDRVYFRPATIVSTGGHVHSPPQYYYDGFSEVPIIAPLARRANASSGNTIIKEHSLISSSDLTSPVSLSVSMSPANPNIRYDGLSPWAACVLRRHVNVVNSLVRSFLEFRMTSDEAIQNTLDTLWEGVTQSTKLASSGDMQSTVVAHPMELRDAISELAEMLCMNFYTTWYDNIPADIGGLWPHEKKERTLPKEHPRTWKLDRTYLMACCDVNMLTNLDLTVGPRYLTLAVSYQPGANPRDPPTLNQANLMAIDQDVGSEADDAVKLPCSLSRLQVNALLKNTIMLLYANQG